MKQYILIIKRNIPLIAITGLLFYWGYKNDGFIRMVIAILIFYSILKSMVKDLLYAERYNGWIRRNQGKLILFYPTKKLIQENIKTEFIPRIPYEIMEVYYDGPKLVGDIRRSIVYEIIGWNKNVKIHTPAILKVIKGEIVVEALNELKRVDLTEREYQILVKKVEGMSLYMK